VPRDCAGWWRRLAAWGIDAVVVIAIITSFGGSVAPSTHSDTEVSVAPGTVNISEPGIGAIAIQGKRHTPATAAPSAPPPPSSAPPGTRSHQRRVWTTDRLVFGPFVLSERGLALRIGSQEIPLSFDAFAQGVAHLGFAFWFPVYLAILVILAGQTFGMMIIGLRVVTTEFGKPSIARTVARYLIVFVLWWLILALSLVWRRILLHDRWTKTRLVKVERVVARIMRGT
jgi:uncharacterized RDD family membrane protein YckC